MKTQRLQVCLTADIEFDVNGALTFPDLHRPCGSDAVFRPIAGKSEGLEPLLQPLQEFRLPATMFVESLQCHHFGLDHMARVVERLRAVPAIDLQLHIHPCWAYFKDPAWQEAVKRVKVDDGMAGRKQAARALIEEAKAFFEQLTGMQPLAMRTGGLSVDADVYRAQAAVGIPLASSIGRAIAPSPDPELRAYNGLLHCAGVVEVPVTSFKALGPRGSYDKLLTLTGNSLFQIKRLLRWHHLRQQGPVVVLTHASEMASTPHLKTPCVFSKEPGAQRRWHALCEYLARNEETFEVLSFAQAWPRWRTQPAAKQAPYNGGLLTPFSQAFSRLGLAI